MIVINLARRGRKRGRAAVCGSDWPPGIVFTGLRRALIALAAAAEVTDIGWAVRYAVKRGQHAPADFDFRPSGTRARWIIMALFAMLLVGSAVLFYRRRRHARLWSLVGVAVALMIGLTSCGGRQERPQPSAPTWAFLDGRASGTTNQRLSTLDGRLETFLGTSIRTVAPTAHVGFRDPLGRIGCGHTDSTDTRDAIVSGLTDDQLRGLHQKLVELWRGFGYNIHADAHPSADVADTISINDFHIAVETRPDVPLTVGGSTPCVDDDSTRNAKQSYAHVADVGGIGAPVFLGLALFARLVRRRSLGDSSAIQLLNILGWVGFALALTGVVYGIGELIRMHLSESML